MKLPGGEDFLKMLRNKEQVVRTILKDFQVSQKNMEGFAKLEELYAEGKDVSTEKVLKSTAKSLRHLNDVNTRVLMLLLVYLGGDNYSSDVAHLAIRFGKGDEALQELMRAKMKGYEEPYG